jgi:hypothetical protein
MLLSRWKTGQFVSIVQDYYNRLGGQMIIHILLLTSDKIAILHDDTFSFLFEQFDDSFRIGVCIFLLSHWPEITNKDVSSFLKFLLILLLLL